MSTNTLDGGVPPWPRAILHLDMDAFFVSVHRLLHPEDEGIPVAVGGRPEGRGVVASASYEARQFGVRSAMPMARAVQLCPKLKIVGHQGPAIRNSSNQVMEILAEYGRVEKMSVDEAYVDVTATLASARPDSSQSSSVRTPGEWAEHIRSEVKRRTGLPCSVGLATSKLVAKVASDFDKPEGCTVVEPGTEAEFLEPMGVRALHGIGPKSAERLNSIGISTCGQLAQAERLALREVLGRHGESLKERALGIDQREVRSGRGPAKSISREQTFAQDIADGELLLAALDALVERVARDLVEQNMVARTVTVKFRMSDFETFSRQTSVDTPIQSVEDIARLARAIFRHEWPENKAMRLVGLGLSKLEPASSIQLSFDLGQEAGEML